MKTLILGFDAFDPDIFEQLYEQGNLPNLGKFVGSKGYSRFEVSNPPQSEVSWTGIATGLNPGRHGIFDFVHRVPSSYTPYVSLLPTTRKLFGSQFVRPSNAWTIFDQAAHLGYPATALWWPATFPARLDSPVRTLPGLGTPDIFGRLGVGTLISSDKSMPENVGKTPVFIPKKDGKNQYSLRLEGPSRKTLFGERESGISLKVQATGSETAVLEIGANNLHLTLGEWSPILVLHFKLGAFMSVRVVTRVILTQISPHIHLYILPLQIFPLKSPWRYGTPGSFVKMIWREQGPYLTIGWPQDTIGLEDGCIDDSQFLTLCDSIFDTRVRILMDQLEHFHEGVLASVFDTLDRIQHMFWGKRKDIIEKWYVKLDKLVGMVDTKLLSNPSDKSRVVIVSDHGFTEFNYKVHLNRWLIDRGYLTPKINTKEAGMKSIDWSRTQAYALGLNSLYLNLLGREGRGQVIREEEGAVLEQLKKELLGWKGPNGTQVLDRVWLNWEAFEGPYSHYGPDMILGYAAGYRASQETGLGSWKKENLETNHDYWDGDHCVSPEVVPGVIFSNQDLSNFPNPSYRDFPALTVGELPDSDQAKPPPTMSDVEDEAIEERMKSLGYL